MNTYAAALREAADDARATAAGLRAKSLELRARTRELRAGRLHPTPQSATPLARTPREDS